MAEEEHGISDQNRGKISQSVEIKVPRYSSEISDIYGSRAAAYVADDDFQPPVDGPSLLGGMRPESPSRTTEDKISDQSQLVSDCMAMNYDASYFPAEKSRGNYDLLQDNDEENGGKFRINKTGKEQTGNISKTTGSSMRKMHGPIAMEDHGVSDRNHGKISHQSTKLKVPRNRSEKVAYDDFESPVDGSNLLGGMRPESPPGTTEDKSDHSQPASDSMRNNYHTSYFSMEKSRGNCDPLQDNNEENGGKFRINRTGTGKEQTRNISETIGNCMRKIHGPTAMEDHGISDQNYGKMSQQSTKIEVRRNRPEVVEDGDSQLQVDGSSLLGSKRLELPSGTTEDHSQLASDSMPMNDDVSNFSMEKSRRNYDHRSDPDIDVKDEIREHDFEILDSIEVGTEVMPDNNEIKNAEIEMLNVASNYEVEKEQNSIRTWYSAFYNCWYTASSPNHYTDNAFFNRMQSEKCEEGGASSRQYLYCRKSNIYPKKDVLDRHEAKPETKKGSSYNGSKINRNQAVSRENCGQTEKSHACDLLTEIPVTETLGDALNCFGLKERLKVIEMNLDKVRKRQRPKEQHESDLKQFDKEIQKLSFKYHPDRVKNRGGSDKELAAAQKLQTALNTTRTVLKVLGEAFLEDIGTDHKYGFYTNLNITSLGNEEDIKSHIHEVVFKISYLSEIKQQHIIAEIRHFLQEGQNCVKWYFEDNEKEFENCRILAMLHLKRCIKGFKKLLAEFGSVEKECISEKKDNIAVHIKNMADKSFELLNDLKDVKKFVKDVPDGRCRFYRPPFRVDDYFVLPFVCYTNVIVMCNAMFKNRQQQSLRRYLPSITQESFDYPETISLNYPYYLASVYSGSKVYKYIIDETLFDKSGDREEIRREFSKALRQANNCLQDTFRTEYYSLENTRANLFMEEYLKCMTMLADFKRQEEEMRRNIERIAVRTQEVEEKFAEAMKESEEDTSRLKERLERSRLLREQVSASLSR